LPECATTAIFGMHGLRLPLLAVTLTSLTTGKPRHSREAGRTKGERQAVCVSDRGGFHGVGIRPSK
jgi:hypothetical protein